MKQLLKNKNILTIMISFIIIVILLGSSSFFRVLNKSLQNQYYSIKNEIVGLKANQHIIIVEIDDSSITEFGSFPFDRLVYAKILDNLKSYKTAVVAFDILFLDPSPRAESDKMFASKIAKYPNVVLGASLSNQGEVQIPSSIFKQKSYETGFLSPNIESSNRTVYSFTPQLRDATGEEYEHFSIKVIRSFYKYLYDDPSLSGIGSYSPSEYLLSPGNSFPLSANNSNEVLINFIPPENFIRISIKDLYSPDRLRQIEREIGLQDKILLIGPAADGLKDDFFTPNGVEYGVNIHANILNTFLSKQFMIYFNKYLEWIMIFFLVILSVSVNLSTSNKVLLATNLGIVAVFWFIIPISVLLGTNLILNYPSEIIFSLLLSFSSANIVKYLIEDDNKKKLNKALSEYVSSNIAQEILEEGGKVNLNGEERELVCFFSDIEGFTTMSENMSPEQLVSFLRDYLTAMTSIIMEKKGHVDKFEGDAIMALWGAFTKPSRIDYIGACDTALAHQKILKKIEVKWKDHTGGPLRIRIGLHAGPAIVGNIGAIGKKMEFTALGDNINLASRLEGVNKFYHTYICVSEAIYIVVKDLYAFRYLDMIQVKGKDIPIKIYELLGTRDVFTIEKQGLYEAFEGALSLYRNRSFEDAKDVFEGLVAQGDLPSQTFVERCQYYIENPPRADWDGVWRMMEK